MAKEDERIFPPTGNEPPHTATEQEISVLPGEAEATNKQVATMETLNKRNVAQFIQRIEAKAELWKKIRVMALQQTSGKDWRIMGEKPYPERNAVSAILNFIGATTTISDRPVREEITDSTGRVDYYYSITGSIQWNTSTFHDMGRASTRDAFFAKRKDKDGKEYLLPLDEIDIQDVQGKSITNLYYRLLSRIFAMPTLQELKEAGVDVTQKIDYGKGSKGGSTDSSPEVKNMRVALGNTIMQISKITGEEGPAILKRLTGFTAKDGKVVPGKDSLNNVSEKQLPYTLKAAQAELDKQEPPQ